MSDDSGKRRSSTWERAYPEDLKKSEERLVRRRHGKCDSCGDSAETGLALSGGGIRSATFGFGVIQALAGLDLLPKIDVLSTVSGGGYTGSLLSRLFTRKEVKDHEDVKRVILPPHASDDAPQEFPSGWVLRWLRENGRYLAPNGSGDLLLGGAIALRNWLSIHLVLTTPGAYPIRGYAVHPQRPAYLVFRRHCPAISHVLGKRRCWCRAAR